MKSPLSLWLLVVALLSASTTNSGAETLYGIVNTLFDGSPAFRTIDRTSGSETLIAVPSGDCAAAWGPRGMAMDPTSGLMYVSHSSGGGDPRDLCTIDLVTAAQTLIATMTHAPRDLTFDLDGVLYGVTPNNASVDPNSLITIDTSTGVGTVRAALTGVKNHVITFSKDDGFLYHLTGSDSGNSRLFRIDKSTFMFTEIPVTSDPFDFGPYAMVYDPFDGLFRLTDRSRNYMTVSTTGIVVDTGIDLVGTYTGFAFDQMTTDPVELLSFDID